MPGLARPCTPCGHFRTMHRVPHSGAITPAPRVVNGAVSIRNDPRRDLARCLAIGCDCPGYQVWPPWLVPVPVGP
jgi:hypothetical protein